MDLSESAALGWRMVRRPAAAVERVLADPRRGLKAGAGVLLAYMLVTAFFYHLKPEGFPPPMEGYVPPEVPRGLGFWLKVQVWTPALAAVLIGTTGWFSALLRGGKLPMRLGGAVLASGIPVLLLVLHAQDVMGAGAFLFAWLLMIGAMAPGWRAFGAGPWKALAAVLMAGNAPAIAMVPLFTLAVLLRAPGLYHAFEIALLFWTLGVCSYGAGRALELPTARAFAAVFLGFLLQIVFVFSMHNAGLLPKDVLKALMAV